MKAKYITDCDDCPIYKTICRGGMIPGQNGIPIEPPCVHWKDDTEVTEDMYDIYDEY